MHNSFQTVWSFTTKRFRVALQIEDEPSYVYDGEDEDGSIQEGISNGELLAFTSRVIVQLDGTIIGADLLGGSIYKSGDESEFWTAHRDPDPMNRNCSIMRAAAGRPVAICHYFPEMVRAAIAEARDHLADIPTMRKRAA